MKSMHPASLSLVACKSSIGYPRNASPPPQQPEQQESQPAPPPQQQDTRSANQVVAELLNGNGYSCQFQNATTGWFCQGPQNWSFYVLSQNMSDGTIHILFDSYVDHALGKRCDGFTDVLADLSRVEGTGFEATCRDDLVQFQLRTRWQYDNLDVVIAATSHTQRAVDAAQQLRGAHTLAPKAAHELANR